MHEIKFKQNWKYKTELVFLQVNNSLQSGEAPALLLILDEVKKLQKTVYLHLGCRKESMKCVCWAKRINRAFFVFYIVTVVLFLTFIFMEWNS